MYPRQQQKINYRLPWWVGPILIFLNLAPPVGLFIGILTLGYFGLGSGILIMVSFPLWCFGLILLFGLSDEDVEISDR